MTAGLVYSNPQVYGLVMKALYGRFYRDRYRSISRLIPNNSTVTELCCGPGFFFEKELRGRVVSYTGLDLNRSFAERVNRLGGLGVACDVSSLDHIPPSDYVVIQASLYQFLPDAQVIVERMLLAARVAVIVAEPVRNLATSRLPVISTLARNATDAGQGRRAMRFNEDSLDAFIKSLSTPVLDSFLIPGGREKVYVLSADHSARLNPDDRHSSNVGIIR